MISETNEGEEKNEPVTPKTKAAEETK